MELESIPYEDESKGFFLYEQREETDEELAERMARDKAHTDRLEARERAELQRLQAKFGK